MAQLSSPGVSVEVTDESFYTSSAPGTVPLIFVATAANKLNSAKTGLAPGTVKTSSKYGQVFKITSTKELANTFGQPIFKNNVSNTPINAGEQNEYGLWAAHSFLNVSSAAYVVRADIDLNQLQPLSDEPKGAPANNTFWLNTVLSHWGVAEWNSDSLSTAAGQKFKTLTPAVITDALLLDTNYAPLSSYGALGTYAISTVTSLISLWYKSPRLGNWVLAGSADWISSIPTVMGTVLPSNTVFYDTPYGGNNADSIAINTVSFDGFLSLDELVTLINASTDPLLDGILAANENEALVIYSTGASIDFTGSNPDTAVKLGIAILSGKSTFLAPALTISSSVNVPTYKRKDNTATVIGYPTGSLWIKTNSVNSGANWIIQKYDSASASWVTKPAPLFPNGAAALASLDPTGGGINLAGNTVYVKYNDAEPSDQLGTFKIYRRRDVIATTITSTTVKTDTLASGSYSFVLRESLSGSAALSMPSMVTFAIPSFPANTSDAIIIDETINTILAAINSRVNTSVHAARNGNRIVISHSRGGDIEFKDKDGLPLGKLFAPISTDNFYHHSNYMLENTDIEKNYIATLWTEFVNDKINPFVTPSVSMPTGSAEDGLLWYNSVNSEVDIMVVHNRRWMAYRNVDHGNGVGVTDPNGPIIFASSKGSKPKYQSNGMDLKEGDLWIDTSDVDNYPALYKYINFEKKWERVDITDQITNDGILFADARWSTNGEDSTPATIKALLGGTLEEYSQSEIDAANFVDFDAPDPVLYPEGMLLWNLRRSGNNVKQLRNNYVNLNALNRRYNNESMSSYHPHRWVSAAPNLVNGVGAFGRMAQRGVVVKAFQALINANEQIKETEVRKFNLLACPGYPEVVGELVNLNNSNGLTAFILGDTPARLTPDATSLENWGSNVAGAVEDNDLGLTTSDPFTAFFYPWGYSSDTSGSNVVVPPSALMLQTIALSDQATHPWFAPAGTSRGAVKLASSVGYVNQSGEYVTVKLNPGQRDTLAKIKVNALTEFVGQGVINMGQYTRAPNVSALDRINVARLVIQLRGQLEALARPYLFQANDSHTRAEVKHAAESLLVELVGKRAIYDYVVVCDGSNNTPADIDNSELNMDIAIEPTKAVEFIYIPLRLLNTGEVKTLGGA